MCAREDLNMRVTLEIDDDVLAIARAIAREQRRSLGEVISDLARRAIHRPQARSIRNGIPLLAVRDNATVATLETVNALRDECI
jgi:hypothetical protein